MAWFAAAIPIASAVLGAMGGGKEEEKPAGPALPPPPSLGEISAMATAAANTSPPPLESFDQYAGPQTPVGGGVG